ncbi:MAG: hypothetical protein C0403_14035 [Desulfobacterium sp.]|nr:hypothetical protein [Desulfobacterium sp.]
MIFIQKKGTLEPISKLSKSVTPAKIGAQKRAESPGFRLSPERQQQTFEIGSLFHNRFEEAN